VETITKLTFLDRHTAQQAEADVGLGPGYVELTVSVADREPLTVALSSDDCGVVASALQRALERLHGRR
jgi:hypothetical protein